MKRYMSLSRLVWLFICLFAVLLVGMLWGVNEHYYRRSEQDARMFAEQSLEETARLLDNRLDSVVTVMQGIAYEGGGFEFCVEGHSWRYENQHYIRTQLNQLMLDSTAVQSAVLYTLDGAYCATGTAMENPYLTYKRLDSELHISEAFKKTLYSQPVSVGDKVLVSVVVPVWVQNSTRSLLGFCGVIIAQIDVRSLLEQVNVTARPLKLAFTGGMVMDGTNGRLLPREEAGLDSRMLSRDVSGCSWTLFHTDVTHDHSASIGQMLQFTILTGVLMFVLHIAFVYLFQRMLVAPVEKLAGTVRHSTSDFLPVGEDISSRNELVLLTRSINEMMERIRRSNEEEAQRLRERATFMQARINPHFLYNNLECIRGMAAMQQYGAIRQLTGVMADIYRYCNHSEPLVLLRDEVQCAEKYICLLSLRYPDRLNLTVQVEEEALDCRVPRMCLQPLMENSIYHGTIGAGRASGTLTLRAWISGGRLCITLTDDGAGMSDEQYDKVNHAVLMDEYAVKHIGVGNVRSRLKLLCGENSSLILHPGETGGVCATMLLNINM